jgi:hypothetical protein
MMFHEDKHVGNIEVAIDFLSGSPAVCGCVPEGTDIDQLQKSLDADLRAVFAKHFIEISTFRPELPFAEVVWSKPIKPHAEQVADFKDSMARLGEMWEAGAEQQKQKAAANPDNGKLGYWQVDGVRHDTMVKASSEPEAIEKAIASGEVGDWESPSAYFVGAELPSRLQ